MKQALYTCTYARRERSVELHTVAFWKLDVTNCVYSYMIAVVCYDRNLPQLPSRLGLRQTDSINSLPSGLHSDNNDCSKRSVCEVEFPKCDLALVQ